MRSYRARHAKPALHPTRTTLATGLAAVLLLPLGFAAPAAAAPAGKATTTMRISGPAGTVAPGHHTIGVRLLTDGRYYPNRYVRIEKTTSKGWVPVGRMLTNANGLARGAFPFTSSTRVRAVYEAGATSTAGTSPEQRVTVSKAAAVKAASRSARSDFRAKAVAVAAAQIGKPYRYGAAGPNSFDCSGLLNYAFRAAGKSLPRTSGAIAASTTRISKAQAVPGDLVYTPGHIGIYAGNGKMIDAPSSGRTVTLRAIYSNRFTYHRVS